MTKMTEPEFIENTAGERRGIVPHQQVTVTIAPDDWLAEVRRFTRPRVIARG